MAKKKNKTEETEGNEPVVLYVGAEHVLEPHYVMLTKDEEGLVTVAVAWPHKTNIPIGAKTVEQIIREAGAELPVDEQTVEITFSPYNGEVIAVAKK